MSSKLLTGLMVSEERLEQRIEGYRVSYVYQGHRYTTQMPYDPGDRIRIRVNVHPADF